MPSAYWDRFYESYFGDPYMAWHDGLDSQALLSLEGDERTQAEKLLTGAIGSSDYRPAAGLARLRSPAAAEKLKKELPQASGSAEVQTALALWQIEKYLPAANTLVRALKSEQHWSVRMEAARAMSNVPTPGVIDALWGAVDHEPEDLVRTHAAESLLEIYNIPKDEYNSHPLAIQLMSGDKETRQEAARKLRELVAKEGRLSSE